MVDDDVLDIIAVEQPERQLYQQVEAPAEGKLAIPIRESRELLEVAVQEWCGEHLSHYLLEVGDELFAESVEA